MVRTMTNKFNAERDSMGEGGKDVGVRMHDVAVPQSVRLHQLLRDPNATPMSSVVRRNHGNHNGQDDQFSSSCLRTHAQQEQSAQSKHAQPCRSFSGASSSRWSISTVLSSVLRADATTPVVPTMSEDACVFGGGWGLPRPLTEQAGSGLEGSGGMSKCASPAVFC